MKPVLFALALAGATGAVASLPETSAQGTGASANPRSLPDAVKHGETLLYTDISAVNTTQALDKLMELDIIRYEFVRSV